MNHVEFMVRVALASFLAIFIFSTSAQGQSRNVADEVERVLNTANQHLRKGEACFQAGEMDCARREFDRAIDEVIGSGLDLRADQRLSQGWREMIEKINQYQISALTDSKVAGWKTQEYDGRPEALSDEQEEKGFEEEVFGPLSPKEFQLRFAELRRRFQKEYNRDIVLTGADHSEHRRLYGKGSAYDIRARDLNRAQVRFIISTGRKLGLRIKDFSTWERVAAHNARVYSLGRPLDTLATGLHLHIDRMAAPKKAKKNSTSVRRREKR